MSIGPVVTRGNLIGSIALLVRRGYSIPEPNQTFLSIKMGKTQGVIKQGETQVQFKQGKTQGRIEP